MADDVNTQVQHLLLRRAIRRTRFENEVIRLAVARFRRAMTDTVSALRHSGAFDGTTRRANLAALLTPGGMTALDQRQKLASLMVTLTGLWRQARSDVGRLLHAHLRDYAELELREVPKAVGDLLQREALRPIQEAQDDITPNLAIAFNSVPAGQIAQLTTSPLGGASGFEQSLQDLSDRLLARVRGTLTTGLIQGQGVPPVAKALQGAMQNLRWEAERIVRSEFTRTAAQAGLVQYQQNRDLLDGVQWVATLDARTCLQCGLLDGETWDSAAEAQVPVVDTHPSCRCIIVPIVKDAKRLGLPPSTRASFSGQVPATLKFPAFLRKQTAAFQREVLGPTRYRLWKQGKLQLRDFVTSAGIRSVKSALALARSHG
jgi:SPP1 gp7 family putative phage head morphogenesis protein